MISPSGQRSPFPGTAGYSHAPNAALLIDFDNVTMGIRSDLGKELKALLNSDVIRGKVAVQRAYADWRRYPQYIVPLAESSIDLIFAPAYGSSKKNATDLRMAIDAIELVFTRPEIGTFILMTGDSDFSSCVLKLKEYGKYVIGVGMRESSSDLLIQNCDEYYSYHSLSGLTRTGEVQESTEDPWVLVRRAAEQMEANGDVMRTDRLKQVMLDLDPAFDEKKLGYSKFSRFVQEAANKGIVRLRKGENGQYELVPSDEVEAAPEAAEGVEPRRGRGREREREPRRDGRHTPSPRQEEVAAETATEKEAEATEVLQPVAEAPPVVGADRETALAEDGTGIEQAYALLQAALRELTSGGAKAVRDGDVKRKMLDLSPGFDEAVLGFSKFTRFLRQAHDAEVIDLQRSNGGNYEVALPASGKRLPPPKSVSAPPARPAAEARAGKNTAAEAVAEKAEPKAELPEATPAAAEGATAPDAAAAAESTPATIRTVGVGALRGRRAGRPGALAGPPPILPGQVVAPATRLAAEQDAAAVPVVDDPSPEATGGSAAAAVDEAAPAAEEARKKSRRGRRGRGRGRGAEAEASNAVSRTTEEAPQPEAKTRAAKPAKQKAAAAAAKEEPAAEAGKEKPAAETPKRALPPEGPIDKITARARRARAIRGDADEAVGVPPILPGQAAKPAPAAAQQAAEEKQQPARRSRGRGRGRKAAEQTTPAAAEAAAFSGLPVDREGIVAHLSAYRGVGVKTAEALYDRFGEGTFRALQSQADEVRELIGPRRAGAVLEQWRADVAGRSASGEAEQEAAPAAPARSVKPAEPTKASAKARTANRRSSGRSGSRATSGKAESAAKAAPATKASASSTAASPKRGGRGSRGGGRRKKETTPSS